MTADELLDHLAAHDVRLEADGERLRYDGPAGAVTGALVEELRRHKPALLARLRADAAAGIVERAPASLGQERMLRRHLAAPRPALFNVVRRIALEGALDPGGLRDALGRLAERHAVLRTRLVGTGGRFVQEVLAPGPPPLEERDLRGRPDPDAEAAAFALAEAERPFTLDEPCLWRAALLRLGDRRWSLVLVLHHVVCDGWSLAILLDDLGALYAAGRSGGAAPPAPAATYAGFARWQRERLRGGTLDELVGFWRRELEGAPAAIALPGDRPPPAARSGRGRVHEFAVPRPVVAHVQAMADRHGTTLYAALVAACALLVSRLAGQQDLVLCANMANRALREHEEVVGLFINSVPLRIRLDRAATFADLLDQAGRTLFRAADHQSLPFDLLLQEVVGDPALRPTAFRHVLVVLRNTPAQALPLPGVRTLVEDVSGDVALTDAMFYLIPGDGELAAAIEYSTDLFDAATIERWAAGFVRLLAEAGRDPDRPLADLAPEAGGSHARDRA